MERLGGGDAGLFGLGDQSSGDFLRPRWRSPVGSMIIANAMNVNARTGKLGGNGLQRLTKSTL
jgi:hypothetical protein